MAIENLRLTSEQHQGIDSYIKKQGGRFYHIYKEPSQIQGSGVYLTHEGDLVGMHGFVDSDKPINGLSPKVEYALTCGNGPEAMLRGAGFDLEGQPAPNLR